MVSQAQAPDIFEAKASATRVRLPWPTQSLVGTSSHDGRRVRRRRHRRDSVELAGGPAVQRTTHRGQRAGTAAAGKLGEGAAVFTRSVSSTPKAALRSPIASASW